MKIFTVCQSGLGTSFMVQMNIQQILEEVGVDTDNFQIDHTDVGSLCRKNIARCFRVNS